MRRSKVYSDELLKELGGHLQNGGLEVSRRKELLLEFCDKYVVQETKIRVAEDVFGKFLMILFVSVNLFVFFLVFTYAVIDLVYHLDDAENRFLDGSIIGGIFAATIAQAVGAFLAFKAKTSE